MKIQFVVLITLFFAFINHTKSEKVYLTELHGATLLNRGLDFRQGGLVPEENVRSPIFDYTYNSGKTFTPAARPDLKFKVPDQVQVQRKQEHIENFSTRVQLSYSEAMSYSVSKFSFSIGINLGFFGFGIGYSREAGRIQYNLRSDFQAIIQGLYYTSTYQAIALPYPLLTQNMMFKTIVDRLATYPRTPQDLEAYKLVMDYYGGWFMWDGIFGGQIKTYGFIKERLVHERTETWRNTQFKFSFHFKLFEISAGGFRERRDIVISKEFLENSNTEIYFTGGFRHLQRNTTLKAWDRSIDDEASMLSGRFRPLSDLLFNQDAKKRNMEWIIKKYSETGKVEAPPSAILVNGLKKIPGYQLIGSGYDPYYMTTRMSVFEQDIDGFEKNSLWENYLNHESFVVPSTVSISESVNEIDSFEISKSLEDYKKSFSNKWIGEYKDGYGMRTSNVNEFKKNHEVKKMIKLTNEKVIHIYDLKINDDVFKNMEKYMNNDLKLMIQNLPTDKSDPIRMKFYRLLIDHFGTHFVVEAKMGGKVEQEVFLNKDILNTHSIDELKEQSNANLVQSLNIRNYDIRKSNVKNWFKENSIVKTSFNGGKSKSEIGKDGISKGFKNYNEIIEKSNETPISEFKKTLENDPGVLRYKIVPITELIKDEKKKQLLVEEIEKYQSEMRIIPSFPTEQEQKEEKLDEMKYWKKFVDELLNKK